MRMLVALVVTVLLGTSLYVMWQKSPSENSSESAVATPLKGQTTGSGEATIGGDFTLTDTEGKAVSTTDFRGKWMLVFFGYTYCPDICQIAAASMSEAMKQLGDDRGKIVPLFITLDPARDDVNTLKAFVQKHDAHFIGLTGDKKQVEDARAKYKVYSAVNPQSATDKNYLVDHSSYMYLMDTEGRYTAHFPHTVEPAKLAEAIKEHLAK